MKTIPIAAALLVGPDGKTLLVRKRGTTAFMQPGGKIDSGETPEAALIRELKEELNLEVGLDDLVPLGQFAAPAANEHDHLVVAEVYRIQIQHSSVRAAAEIEEIIWISPVDPGNLELAPLTAHHILPHHRNLA